MRVAQPTMPLEIIYRGITATRNWLYDREILSSYRSKYPVISVGNIQAGGSGKTPLVRYIVELLKRAGRSPVVLSRGYGGSERGPHQVRTGDTAARVGDEALLHFDAAPVVVARKRSAGAKLIERQALGNVIVLDDGMQHRALARDLEIVSVNIDSESAITDFLEGSLLPGGRFRESRDAALARADLVVFSRRHLMSKSKELDQRLRKVAPKVVDVYQSYLKSARVQAISGSGELPQGSRVQLLSGIANPEGFEATVKELGFVVFAVHRFPDHKQYRAAEIERLRAAEVPVICTQKDGVKLGELAWPGLYVLSFDLTVEPEELFRVRVLEALTR